MLDLLTTREVADYLRVSTMTVYRMAADGSLPSFRVGSSLRYHRADIEALAARPELEQDAS